MAFQASGLWDHLTNRQEGDYTWKKEERPFANCYVCYYGKKEIGFIPITFSKTDLEWQNWWDTAYKRFPDGLTLGSLMREITNRHKR